MPIYNLRITSPSDWFHVETSNGAFVKAEDQAITITGENLGIGLQSDNLSLTIGKSSVHMGKNTTALITINVQVRTDQPTLDLRICKGSNGWVRVESQFSNVYHDQVTDNNQNCLPFKLAVTRAARQEMDDDYERSAEEAK